MPKIGCFRPFSHFFCFWGPFFENLKPKICPHPFNGKFPWLGLLKPSLYLLTTRQTQRAPRPPCWMLRLEQRILSLRLFSRRPWQRQRRRRGRGSDWCDPPKSPDYLTVVMKLGGSGGQGDWWRQLCSFTWSLFQLLSACRQENRSSNLEKKCCFFKIEEKQGVGRQGGRESFFKKLPIKQSMTFQDREFFIFLVVSEKIGTRKKSRNRHGKIWYRKKSRNR